MIDTARSDYSGIFCMLYVDSHSQLKCEPLRWIIKLLHDVSTVFPSPCFFFTQLRMTPRSFQLPAEQVDSFLHRLPFYHFHAY